MVIIFTVYNAEGKQEVFARGEKEARACMMLLDFLGVRYTAEELE